MRFAFIDEAGLSKKAHEPYLVMAGALIDPDSDYRRTESEIRALVDQHFPGTLYGFGEQFNFHAKDIWHGSGSFPRDSWRLQERLSLLSDLVKIISQNSLPVVYGFVDRQKHAARRKEEWPIDPVEKDIANDAASIAYFHCVKRIEQWMRENAADEVASLTLENSPKIKRVIEGLHALIVNRIDQKEPFMTKVIFSFPITQAAHFVEKKQSPLIQLADVAAFVLKRKLQGCKRIGPIYDELRPVIFNRSSPGTGLALGRNTDVALIADWLKRRD